MRFASSLIAIAATLCTVQADFMVYTVPPIPTDAIPSFTDQAAASSWTTSVYLNGLIAYNAFTKSLGPTYQSSRTSVASEIAAFASSASNYSIPAAVTDDSTTTTFYSKPNWYTALPSDARAFKEQQVSDQFSIVRSVIAARATTAKSTGGAVPTARVFVDARFGVMAAAAAAAFL